MNYFKILVFLQKGDKSDFDIPKEEQNNYLISLGTPKNDIDRGFKQYLCQNFFVPGWKVLFFNIVAAVAFPISAFYYLFKRIEVGESEVIDAMIENKGMEEVIPLQVYEKYHPSTKDYNKGASLSLKDVLFSLKLVCRAPHHPYFVFKAMMNVARYSDMLKRHQPKVMIQFGEFSFSSSILTAFCQLHGVKHINVMHGEKIFSIRDTFFRYDECYVWDEHYVKLFHCLKAEPNQFRIAIPPSLKIDVASYKNKDVYSDYKYYLAIVNENEMKTIVESMQFAKRCGKCVKYRPHPRYTDMDILTKYVGAEEIELPKEVGILESISNLEYAVGSFTTVLTQAYFSGKKVLLDDMTYKSEYDKLEELDFIISSKNVPKLSEMQG